MDNRLPCIYRKGVSLFAAIAILAVAVAPLVLSPGQARAEAALPEPSKTKIAVFDFELEDKSAGGGIIAQDAYDTKYLSAATDEAKRLLVDTGRFVIVETKGTATLDKTARKFGIRNCHGCEAAAAQKLGSEQAMIGVVTRVNRTEHTLLIKIVDARTGAPISSGFTDLRMGANYAWPRSVKWLMHTRLLASQRQ